ncbi:MAG: hypothetical protein V8Q27_05540 [Eubacteriales bacterium]
MKREALAACGRINVDHVAFHAIQRWSQVEGRAQLLLQGGDHGFDRIGQFIGKGRKVPGAG